MPAKEIITRRRSDYHTCGAWCKAAQARYAFRSSECGSIVKVMPRPGPGRALHPGPGADGRTDPYE